MADSRPVLQEVAKVGVLASTASQMECLHRAVLESGFAVGGKLQALSKNLHQIASADVDAWLVQLDFQNGDSDRAIMDVLEAQQKPVIYADLEPGARADNEESLKRLTRKVAESVHGIVKAPQGLRKAKEVWVLAASLGGPEAVAAFLKALPQSCGEVAFLYVQHITEGFEGSLLTMVERNCTWRVFDSEEPRMLATGCIYIVSPKGQIAINDGGWMHPIASPWRGSYRPSINQVLAKVARRYGSHCGAIIFSGMGDDGSASCGFMKHSGGKVWAQELTSCVVDSMPREAINSKGVSFVATPAQLAARFDKRHFMATN